MIINELLIDKYKVQKTLDQQVGHSLPAYVAETHDRVRKLSVTLGLNFRYGRPGMIPEEKEPNKAADTDAYTHREWVFR